MIDGDAPRRRLLLGAVALVTGSAGAQMGGDREQRFPDVVAVDVRPAGSDHFDFDVTISSPYDTPGRYADGFRIFVPDGPVFGSRALLHDHQHEQPFTRELRGVRIPPSVTTVRVQARDQRFGYGGKAADVRLPGR